MSWIWTGVNPQERRPPAPRLLEDEPMFRLGRAIGIIDILVSCIEEHRYPGDLMRELDLKQAKEFLREERDR